MRKHLLFVLPCLALSALLVAACGGAEASACFTKARVRDRIAKIDTYSWYEQVRHHPAPVAREDGSCPGR
jgi:hypothetical protein